MKCTTLFRAWLLAVFLSVASYTAMATHIVGGELEVTHVSGDTYDISMIMYFDAVNGNPGALDNFATISSFARDNNARVQTFELALTSNTLVQYSNPECQIASLRTRRLLYSGRFTLQTSLYDDPDGYYFAYERCCRNGVIENLFQPGETGQTFYLEFPPLIRGGNRFINSSPSLFPPLSDFATLDRPFFADFRGSDPDGDSLVYSLVHPLRGNTDRNNPAPPQPSSAPYPLVQFLGGYDVQNMVRGNPSLQIDTTGFLTVTPSETGLYVFAVKCEEYRNGEKIGEVRRDFQMLVIQQDDVDPPLTQLQTAEGSFYQLGDTLKIQTASGQDTCFTVSVSDPNGEDDFRYEVFFNGQPTSLAYINGIGALNLAPSETGNVDLCFRDCPNLPTDSTYSMTVIIGDNSCAKPLFDTLHIVFELLPEPNAPPNTTVDLVETDTGRCPYQAEVAIGERIEFLIEGRDDVEGDSLTLFMETPGFDPQALGIDFPDAFGRSPISQTFVWRPDCDVLDSGEFERFYQLDFVTGDFGLCGIKDTSKACVSLRVFFEEGLNRTPIVIEPDRQTELILPDSIYRDTIIVGQSYRLDIRATDQDGDRLTLRALGKGFDLSSLGMQFSTVTGAGFVENEFRWTPPCAAVPGIANGDFEATYTLHFIAADENLCWVQSRDTLTLELVVAFRPPPNQPPTVLLPIAPSPGDPDLFERNISVGQGFFSIPVRAVDIDSDALTLMAEGIGFALPEINADFNPSNPITGLSSVEGNLLLDINCSLLAQGFADQQYDILFVAADTNQCQLVSYDSATLRLNIQDIPQIELTPFPNAFSPNDDGIGDVFRIDNLPIDNCKDQFEEVIIYSRWGKEVFRSRSRTFAWDGDNAPSGSYYYLVRFANSEFKGPITLFRD